MAHILPSNLRRRARVLFILLAALLAAVGYYRQADRQDHLNQALFAAIRDDDTPTGSTIPAIRHWTQPSIAPA